MAGLWAPRALWVWGSKVEPRAAQKETVGGASPLVKLGLRLLLQTGEARG